MDRQQRQWGRAEQADEHQVPGERGPHGTCKLHERTVFQGPRGVVSPARATKKLTVLQTESPQVSCRRTEFTSTCALSAGRFSRRGGTKIGEGRTSTRHAGERCQPIMHSQHFIDLLSLTNHQLATFHFLTLVCSVFTGWIVLERSHEWRGLG